MEYTLQQFTRVHVVEDIVGGVDSSSILQAYYDCGGNWMDNKDFSRVFGRILIAFFGQKKWLGKSSKKWKIRLVGCSTIINSPISDSVNSLIDSVGSSISSVDDSVDSLINLIDSSIDGSIGSSIDSAIDSNIPFDVKLMELENKIVYEKIPDIPTNLERDIDIQISKRAKTTMDSSTEKTFDNYIDYSSESIEDETHVFSDTSDQKNSEPDETFSEDLIDTQSLLNNDKDASPFIKAMLSSEKV